MLSIAVARGGSSYTVHKFSQLLGRRRQQPSFTLVRLMTVQKMLRHGKIAMRGEKDGRRKNLVRLASSFPFWRFYAVEVELRRARVLKSYFCRLLVRRMKC